MTHIKGITPAKVPISVIAPRNSYPLSGRATCHWRMLPGLITLALSIAAAVYTFFFLKMKYLTIAPGVGALISLYFIYLGNSYHELYSIEESCNRMQDQVVTMAIQNVQFERQIKKLDDQIGKLKAQNDRLDKIIEEFNKKFAEHSTKFTNLHTAFQKLFKESEGELQKKLDKHSALIQELANTSALLVEKEDAAEKNNQAQLEIMIKMSEVANALVTALATCNIEELTKQVLKNLEIESKFNATISKCEKTLQKLQGKTKQEEESLQKKKEELNQVLTDIKVQVSKLDVLKDLDRLNNAFQSHLTSFTDNHKKLDNTTAELRLLINDIKEIKTKEASYHTMVSSASQDTHG